MRLSRGKKYYKLILEPVSNNFLNAAASCLSVCTYSLFVCLFLLVPGKRIDQKNSSRLSVWPNERTTDRWSFHRNFGDFFFLLPRSRVQQKCGQKVFFSLLTEDPDKIQELLFLVCTTTLAAAAAASRSPPSSYFLIITARLTDSRTHPLLPLHLFPPSCSSSFFVTPFHFPFSHPSITTLVIG